jgi:hypothetical protein
MLFLDKSSPEMSALQQLSNINLPAIPYPCVLDPDCIMPLVQCHCEYENLSYDLFTFLELCSIIGIKLLCHSGNKFKRVKTTFGIVFINSLTTGKSSESIE